MLKSSIILLLISTIISKDTVQEKTDDISEYFLQIDHSEQSKFIDQITAECAKFKREENTDNDYILS